MKNFIYSPKGFALEGQLSGYLATRTWAKRPALVELTNYTDPHGKARSMIEQAEGFDALHLEVAVRKYLRSNIRISLAESRYLKAADISLTFSRPMSNSRMARASDFRQLFYPGAILPDLSQYKRGPFFPVSTTGRASWSVSDIRRWNTMLWDQDNSKQVTYLVSIGNSYLRDTV